MTQNKEKPELDWRGLPVPECESLDERFLVWVIETPEAKCDIYIRSYHEAIKYAQNLIEQLMDSTEEEELKEHGVDLKVRLKEVNGHDMLELYSEDEI